MKKIKLFALLAFVSVWLTSCYTWYESRIGVDETKIPASLAGLLYKPEEIKSLEAPEQVIASQGYYSGSVRLRWSEVPYATSYRIERAAVPKDSGSLPEDGDFSVISEYVYDTTYTDTILSNPAYTSNEYQNKYYYRISAENIGRGLESSEYTDISDSSTKGLGWLLPPPQNVDASKGDYDDYIKITWNKVAGANSYKIYRGESIEENKTPEDFRMQEIGTIRGSETSFINKLGEAEKGKEYYYQICAVHNIGSSSAKSSFAMGYSLLDKSLTAPNDLIVKEGNGESTSVIKLEWTATPGDYTYSIYKTTNLDSSYKLVKKNIPSSTGNTTDEENLKPGIIYYYYIQAVKSSGEKSAFSKKGPFGYLLSSPTTLEVADAVNAEGNISDQFVTIRWMPAIGEKGSEYDFDNEYSYKIYYSDTLDGDFASEITASPLSTTELTKSEDGYYEYVVAKKQFYKMTTINASGTESAKSNTIASLPDAPKNVYASKTEGGALITNYVFDATGECYNNNEVYPVRITWDAPDSNPAPAGYNIYRSTKKDSSFRKLNDELITETSFIDLNETARAGTYYYYKVVSINVLDQGKKSNDPVKDTNNNCGGYGAITRNQWFREYNKTIMRSQSKLKLMHKPNDMDKLGSETINGDFSGTLSYNAKVAGIGAEITMHYENYCDFNIGDDPSMGRYFVLTGNTDTTSNMSANGNMHETVRCTGMYPGYAIYNHLEIKGGAAGGGYYLVETKDLYGNQLLAEDKVNWLVGEEK